MDTTEFTIEDYIVRPFNYGFQDWSQFAGINISSVTFVYFATLQDQDDEWFAVGVGDEVSDTIARRCIESEDHLGVFIPYLGQEWATLTDVPDLGFRFALNQRTISETIKQDLFADLRELPISSIRVLREAELRHAEQSD